MEVGERLVGVGGSVLVGGGLGPCGGGLVRLVVSFNLFVYKARGGGEGV